jgi:hypothetical protein
MFESRVLPRFHWPAAMHGATFRTQTERDLPMNRPLLLLAGVAVLGLAACDHPDAARQREANALKVVNTLDCPERQGELKRSTTASDGLSCVYASDRAEVTLRVIQVGDGTPSDALAPIEAELKALLPDVKTTSQAPSSPDDVDIRLPGVSIQAGESGAKVRAPGVEVNAVDGGGAEVRATRNFTATLAGEKRRGEGVSARYILASDAVTGEWKVVGYDARGPVGGPLVVGVVKVRDKQGEHDDIFEDVSDLVRHNVGGRDSRAAIIVD